MHFYHAKHSFLLLFHWNFWHNWLGDIGYMACRNFVQIILKDSLLEEADHTATHWLTEIQVKMAIAAVYMHVALNCSCLFIVTR